MLRTIIFDAYGTLLDTGSGSVEAAGKILEKNGRGDIPPQDFYARWKQLHRRHMDQAGPFLNEESIYHLDLQKLYAEYNVSGDADRDVQIMLATLGNRTPYPEAKEVLETLGGMVGLAIGSVSDTEPLQRDLARGGLKIEKIFTSEGLRCYKPAPAFYRAVLGQLGLQPEEALFVGDSLSADVEGPQAVGIPACWVDRKGAGPGNITPAYTVPDLRGLVPLARRLLGRGKP